MIRFPEKFRIRSGQMASAPGGSGAFSFQLGPTRERAVAIASSEGGWEHVSVSLPNRCPTWAEMCFVKRMFWSDEDCVVQYHPPKLEYVDCHPHCLHLWRPLESAMPRPPHWMVGPLRKDATA